METSKAALLSPHPPRETFVNVCRRFLVVTAGERGGASGVYRVGAGDAANALRGTGRGQPPCGAGGPHPTCLQPGAPLLRAAVLSYESPRTIQVRGVAVEMSYPWFAPRIPDDPVLRPMADTPAGHGDYVVYVGPVVVFSIDAAGVVRHLLRCHYTAAESRERMSAFNSQRWPSLGRAVRIQLK